MATSVILPNHNVIEIEDRSSCADNVVALSNKTYLPLPPPPLAWMQTNPCSLLKEMEISHNGYTFIMCTLSYKLHVCYTIPTHHSVFLKCTLNYTLWRIIVVLIHSCR